MSDDDALRCAKITVYSRGCVGALMWSITCENGAVVGPVLTTEGNLVSLIHELAPPRVTVERAFGEDVDALMALVRHAQGGGALH